MICAECGAVLQHEDDSCGARFDELLALDHSHREPWGSRHAQAFAAFALQHPALHARSLDQAWALLYRIYVNGQRAVDVVAETRAAKGKLVSAGVPPRTARSETVPAVTIVDLGAFEAETYAEKLDAWCRAALATWGAATP